MEGIKTFDELLEKHGQGYGCEVCKPTVGSLLASCWNEYILKPQHTPLQDSNDNFLANIQKDGTYSVIPRSAGGEITPEGLVAVGRIAREFNLYTKITGSQRIGLFGAQKDDLPEIWRQLIEAGFETGHAYAKALRMAKTCVGSTVPLRRWRQRRLRRGTGKPLQRHPHPAQNEVRRLRLHPRMCRGSGQRRRDHRHRERLEPVRAVMAG